MTSEITSWSVIRELAWHLGTVWGGGGGNSNLKVGHQPAFLANLCPFHPPPQYANAKGKRYD